MIILRKHIQALGFKGSHPFESSFQSIWYRSFPKERAIVGISNYSCIEGVFRFDLSAENMKAFEQGKLSVVPPGCCNASGGRSLTRYTWVHKGVLKNQRELHEALASTGLFTCLLQPKSGKNSSPKKTQKRCSLTTSTKR